MARILETTESRVVDPGLWDSSSDWKQASKLDGQPLRDGKMVFFVSNLTRNGTGSDKQIQAHIFGNDFFETRSPTKNFSTRLGVLEKGWASQLNNTTKTNRGRGRGCNASGA
ncbi:hypothetical protein LTR84_012642 [Exophiala bonariae]|uniref:Uncharacterized protein n=1 Tax=Exophiala bonariae TaxID=1690606 RepID=A0AAV9NH72_9EURO|nr:hypothetical protein LTR84_012642 [Exophiala bonariae]